MNIVLKNINTHFLSLCIFYPVSARPGASNDQDLADELFTALHSAAIKTSGTVPHQPNAKNSNPIPRTNSIPVEQEAQQAASIHPRLIKDPNSHRSNPDNPPPLSQFSESFLEDKRHLGTRDADVTTFQPAILLSPPRQRDRSTLARSRVGAYPVNQHAIGTFHSADGGGVSGSYHQEGDLSVRIAQLSKQHEVAQNRLRELKNIRNENGM